MTDLFSTSTGWMGVVPIPASVKLTDAVAVALSICFTGVVPPLILVDIFDEVLKVASVS